MKTRAFAALCAVLGCFAGAGAARGEELASVVAGPSSRAGSGSFDAVVEAVRQTAVAEPVWRTIAKIAVRAGG